MRLGNGDSRGGVVIALCLALAGAVAAAFAACASGQDDAGADSPDSAGPNASDAKQGTADTAPGKPHADVGASDLDGGVDPETPDASVPDVDTNTPDTNVPDTNAPYDAAQDVVVLVDSSGGTCGGLIEWFAGTTATHVQHGGEKYTCIVPGWCSDAAPNSVAAYEPGEGWAWTQAWNDDGVCP